MTPFNNRMWVDIVETKKEQTVGQIVVPEYVKERRDLPKFLKVKVLKIAPNIAMTYGDLEGKEVMIETGGLEEVKIDNKVYHFAVVAYIVCIL